MTPVEQVLASIDSKLEGLDKKIEAVRSEGAQRGGDVAAVRVEVVQVREDLRKLTDRVEIIEKKPEPPDHADHATVDGLRALESSIEAKEGVQTRINRGVCKALGLDYDALSAPQASLTATQAIRRSRAENPPVTLKRVSRNQTIAGVITLAINIIILLRVLLQH